MGHSCSKAGWFVLGAYSNVKMSELLNAINTKNNWLGHETRNASDINWPYFIFYVPRLRCKVRTHFPIDQAEDVSSNTGFDLHGCGWMKILGEKWMSWSGWSLISWAVALVRHVWCWVLRCLDRMSMRFRWDTLQVDSLGWCGWFWIFGSTCILKWHPLTRLAAPTIETRFFFF